MIRTIEPQLIDAQNKITDTVYFDVVARQADARTQTRQFIIGMFTKEVVNGIDQFTLIGSTTAIFKETTFLFLFGDLTMNQFESTINSILMDQIEYANTHTWTGTEVMPKVQYWDLLAEDLEVYTPVTAQQ